MKLREQSEVEERLSTLERRLTELGVLRAVQ